MCDTLTWQNHCYIDHLARTRPNSKLYHWPRWPVLQAMLAIIYESESVIPIKKANWNFSQSNHRHFHDMLVSTLTTFRRPNGAGRCWSEFTTASWPGVLWIGQSSSLLIWKLMCLLSGFLVLMITVGLVLVLFWRVSLTRSCSRWRTGSWAEPGGVVQPWEEELTGEAADYWCICRLHGYFTWAQE